MSEVTLSNTKQQIFDAFQKAQQALKAAQAGKVDIKADQQALAQDLTLKAAAQLSGQDIESLIVDLKKSTAQTLDKLAAQISEKSGAFTTLSDAVDSKRIELEELFGIEESAHALVALVNAKEATAAEYDAKFAERKADADAQLADIQKQIKDAREGYQADLRAQQQADQQARDRKKSEWEYEFNRTTRAAEDRLNDELAGKRKTFNAECEAERNVIGKEADALVARKEILDAREEVLDALQQKVDEIPAQIDAAVRAAEGKQAGILRSQFESEKKLIAAESKAEVTIKDNQIVSLTVSLSKANAEIDSLREQLAKATENVKDMALKSIESSSDSKLAASLSRTVSELSSNKQQGK